MKRFLVILLAIICVASMVGCKSEADYLAADKTFTFEGLNITLTEAFEVDSQNSESVWYESYDETSVAIDVFDMTGIDMPLDEFVSFSIDSYSLLADNISELKTGDGFVYFDYDTEMAGFKFKYMEAFYKSGNRMWNVYFMCDLEDYDEYREYFMKWANSVVIP